MAMARSGWRLALAGLVVLALAACAEVIRYHGFIPPPDELEAIAVGKDTRETVGDKIGPPATGGVMADGAWYYVQSRWAHRGARAPQEVDREVVAISFDTGGKVSNVEHFGLEDGQVVALSRRVTDTNVKSIGFVRQMMGNLGRFDPGQFLQ